jgi:cytochrome c
MDQFLTAPGRHIPGTKMSFAGIRDTATRVNLIAWLRTQGSGGMAVPAPDPARQPGASAGLIEDELGVAGAEGVGQTDTAPVTGAAGQPTIVESTGAPPASDSPAPPNN